MSAFGVMATALVVLAALAAGCTSTQEKSRELADEGLDSFTQKGLRITERNRAVDVVRTSLVSDGNGTAAVVELRSRARRPEADVPVAIDVRGGRRRSAFRNDEPGLQPSLIALPALAPGERVVWVHDQVFPEGRPRRVAATVGAARSEAPTALPRLTLAGVRRVDEGGLGVAAVGFVRNRSPLPQENVPVWGVVRRGGRVVAAGRALVRRVLPGKRARFRVLFIGDPRRGRLDLDLAPTRLR